MLAKNESQMDRAIRLVVGLVLLAVGYQIGGWLQIVLWILAIIALITAATGTCYLYKILGMNTAEGEVTKPAEAKTEEPKTMAAVEPEEEEEAEEEMPVEETKEETVEEEPEEAEEVTETVEEAPKEETKE